MLKKISIKNNQIDIAISPNCLDILPIISHDKIKSEGISYVKEAINLSILLSNDKSK